MDRPTILVLIALTLAGYGIYMAGYLPGLLGGEPLLLVGFLLQVVFALLAAFCVWRRRSPAATFIILLGLTVAATSVVEAFVLQIVAYMHALAVAVGAIVVSLLVAAYVRGSSRLADPELLHPQEQH